MNESLVALYRRARAFVWLSSLSLGLLALSFAAYTSANRTRQVQETAWSEAQRFERRLEQLTSALIRGDRLEGVAVARYAIDGQGVIRRARPGWLEGLNIARSDHPQIEAEGVGQVHLSFAPDVSDMTYRIALLVRGPTAVEVATLPPAELFVTELPGMEVRVVDPGGVCRFSPSAAELGERVSGRWLEVEGWRLRLSSVRGLEQTGGLRLVVTQDVTAEAGLIGLVLTLALGVAWVTRALARRLGSHLQVLQAEAVEVREAIEGLSELPSLSLPLEQSASALRERLRGPLEGARRLRPRFEEHRVNLELACALSEQVQRLLERVERGATELAQSEQRLRHALIDAPLPILLHTREGVVGLVNRAWTTSSGYREEDLGTVEDWVRLAGREEADGGEGMRALLQPGETAEGAVQITTAGGERREWEITSAALDRTLVVTVAADVTERRALEARLRHHEKLQAIGELAGGVAHDFNNQLTVILAYTELLEETAQPEQQELVEAIRSGAERSADLTRRLLAFARRGKHLDVALDVHVMLEELVRLLERSVSKQIVLERSWEARSAWVQGDPTQLQNALLNLALNASDAMPDGGTLRFGTRSVRREGVEGIEVSIRDTGQGIPPELRARVFEPFFTSKPEGVGTGLGLAAVYGTVRAHQGAVEFDSECGVGTEFRLWLPTQGPGSPEAARPRAAPSRGVARVLVIDDEPQVRSVTVRLIAALGHRVVSDHTTGGEGLQAFAEDPQGVDLVLLDLLLPDRRGESVLAELLTLRPDVPVVLLSGYTDNETVQSLLDQGARGFLAKPFSRQELQEAIEAVLAPPSQ